MHPNYKMLNIDGTRVMKMEIMQYKLESHLVILVQLILVTKLLITELLEMETL